MNKLHIIILFLAALLFSGCGGSSSGSSESWLNAPNGEYDEYDEYNEEYNYSDTHNNNILEYPVDVEILAGVSLQQAGQEAYRNLLDWEERYNFGGVKLCAEMSADQAGKHYSSFSSPTNITFLPPAEIHLHQINVTDSSSNIICRIVNGNIEATVGNIQNDIYRTSTEQPAFIVNITVSNRTTCNISVVIPLGQMLEVQTPDVQNIVVSDTYAAILEPYQTKTFSVRAYCAAEKRKDPTYHSAKLTPFVLTAPIYAYNSQQSLWRFLETRPTKDKYYTITFYAWGKGDDIGDRSSKYGHAFVNIPEIGTVGFGRRKEELIDLNPIPVYVAGNLSDHTDAVQYAKYTISIPVNEYFLRRAQNKYQEWKNDSVHYTLGLYDCTAFTMDIADAAGIYYGLRWLIQTPVGFMGELRTYNE